MAQQRTRNITSTTRLVELLRECEPSFEYPEGMGGITEDLYHKGRGTNFEPNLIRSSEVLEVYKGLPEHVRVNLWQLVGYTFRLMYFDEDSQRFADWLKMVITPGELELYEESRH